MSAFGSLGSASYFAVREPLRHHTFFAGYNQLTPRGLSVAAKANRFGSYRWERPTSIEAAPTELRQLNRFACYKHVALTALARCDPRIFY